MAGSTGRGSAKRSGNRLREKSVAAENSQAGHRSSTAFQQRRSSSSTLVEGPIDALAVVELLGLETLRRTGDTVIGAPGTSGFSVQTVASHTGPVTLWTDGDDGGYLAALRLARALQRLGRGVELRAAPAGLDWADVAREMIELKAWSGAGAVNRCGKRGQQVRVRSTGAGAVNRCGCGQQVRVRSTGCGCGQQVRKAWSAGAESVVSRCGKRGQQVRKAWSTGALLARSSQCFPYIFGSARSSRSPRSSRKGRGRKLGGALSLTLRASQLSNCCSCSPR